MCGSLWTLPLCPPAPLQALHSPHYQLKCFWACPTWKSCESNKHWNSCPVVIRIVYRYLGGGQLSEVPADLFQHISSVQKIDLTGTQLQSIPEGLFDPVTLSSTNMLVTQIFALPQSD